jgi:hypothetical protein
MLRRLWPALALVVGLFASAAEAHYPFFAIDPTAGDKGTVNLYFEEAAKPGTGEYLDPFLKDGSYWIRTPDGVPTPLKMQEVLKGANRWMAVALETARPRSIEGYCKWGVYRGNLLHYYTKHIDAATPEQMKALSRSEKLKFDLVPQVAGDTVEVQVLWQGKPKTGQDVTIFGPGLRVTEKSDAEGMVRFKPAKPGLYAMRTAFVEPDIAGKDNNQDYKGVRQTATMTLNLPLTGK